MNGKIKYTFNENDEKAAKLFINLGLPTNLAKTLVYISQVDECQSIEIEHGTFQRQPEVSVATQELLLRGWIRRTELKKEGKGRPIHLYKFSVNIKEILDYLGTF